ncbi:MAG: hypothetical protein ACFFCD_05415 [Promethearchaeota archaeon]
MIHNILLIKEGACIYNYKAGTKSLDANLINGLLEAIFGIGQIFFQKQINKIMFQEVRTVFRALTKKIILGVIEDIDTDNEIIELILKEISNALHQLVLILEYEGINPLTLSLIPSLKEELKYALDRTLLKIPCPFLRKKRFSIIRGYFCTFAEKSLGRSPLCSLYESKNCPYLKNMQLWQLYRTPFDLNDGLQVDQMANELGRWKKIERYALHVFNSNGTTNAMDLRSKLKVYEIDVSPKKALDIISRLEEQGYLIRGSPLVHELQ